MTLAGWTIRFFLLIWAIAFLFLDAKEAFYSILRPVVTGVPDSDELALRDAGAAVLNSGFPRSRS